MIDRFDTMALFLKVVEHGSFSAAGRTLRVPVPTLSRKISGLEAQLGARLLTRTTRKLMLTDAGATYAEAARRIIEQVEEAERQAAGEFVTPRGDLIVTAPIFFGRLHVLPVITEFLAAFPEINVRLILSDRNIDLIDDNVDMAVRIGALPDSAMIATLVGTMRIVTAASPALIERYGAPQTPADLRHFPAVTTDALLGSAPWRFRHPGAEAKTDVPMAPRLSVSTTEAAAEAAIRHVGAVRLFHYQVAAAVSRGQLHLMLEEFEPPPVPINLIHVARRQMPLKMRCFIDFAGPRLRQALIARD